MLETVLNVVEFVVALSILILVHELGHFLAARLFKIEVEEFGLGYPPRMLTLFTAGGTKFSLNWLPFGGFNRLKGETDDNVPGAFINASPWKRIGVLIAGSTMNLLTAVILWAIIIAALGRPDTSKVEILGISPNSPAEEAGLRSGDLILKVNDQNINSLESLSAIVVDNLDEEISLLILRESQEGEFTLVPRSNPPEGQGAIGVMIGNPTVKINPIAALPYGVVATYDYSVELFSFLGRTITGNAAPGEGRLSGLKGMFDMYEEAQAETDSGIPPILNVLYFFASIAISLGLLNLLPFPGLDGGQIILTLPEIILRRRVPPQYHAVVNMVGLAILIVLMIYINVRDFISPAVIP